MASQFIYRNDELYCEQVKIEDIINKVGSPVYIYSKKAVLDAYRNFEAAFAGIDHLVCYSMKANSNLTIAKMLVNEGCGLDCYSGGEFYKALKTEIDPKKIVFAGVGKTEEEIRMVLEHDVLMLKAESRSEMKKINEIAGQLGKKANIGIRINPDVDPKTHPYISTGLS